LDPRDLNAGPDLQLYERVPMQNEVPESRKIKVPIEKNEIPIQNKVPDSRKIQGTDTKNEGTDTVPHKEKCGVTQDKIKGRKPTSEQKF
jgi:hypothetical protein